MRLIHYTFHLALFSTVLAATSSADSERQHVLTVVGASGVDEYAGMFREWANRWRTAAESAGAEFCQVGTNEGTVDSDKKNLSKQIDAWSKLPSTEPLWIVFIGHGTYDGRAAHFNLRGPDISASETAALLQDSKRPIAVINCASCSGPFINALSNHNRVILTATKSGSQHQLTRFGDAISIAVTGVDGDLNRDGQVSLLEAWAFAARRTQEYYEADGRLATEHALLDDNGDQLGSRVTAFAGIKLEPAVEADQPDGDLARQWCLVPSKEERRLSSAQRLQRSELESQLEDLRRNRGDEPEIAYLEKLERVLVPLARLYREIDAGVSDAKKDPSTGAQQPASGE